MPATAPYEAVGGLNGATSAEEMYGQTPAS